MDTKYFLKTKNENLVNPFRVFPESLSRRVSNILKLGSFKVNSYKKVSEGTSEDVQIKEIFKTSRICGSGSGWLGQILIKLFFPNYRIRIRFSKIMIMNKIVSNILIHQKKIK